jgi:selenoprotein W-related protein
MSRLEIECCTQCRWLLRAAWIAQELLTTFDVELGEVALIPATGGVLVVRVGDDIVLDHNEQGFLDLLELKRRVRDRVAQGLGTLRPSFSLNPPMRRCPPACQRGI